MDNESVGFSEKRDGAGSLVVSSVPNNGLRLLEGLVGRNGVESVVSRAGSEYIHKLRVARQRCVVPDKRDIVVDLVVAGRRHGIRGNHGSTACRVARIKHGCRARL